MQYTDYPPTEPRLTLTSTSQVTIQTQTLGFHSLHLVVRALCDCSFTLCQTPSNLGVGVENYSTYRPSRAAVSTPFPDIGEAGSLPGLVTLPSTVLSGPTFRNRR